jgi:hypothetical protein
MPHRQRAIPTPDHPVSSLALAQQLERAEGSANAAFVEARRALKPNVRGCWTEVAGAYAMFDGPDSPITQTFGVGIFEQFREAEFEQTEAFFRSRGAPTSHEVCSYAAPETVSLLSARGYSPIESSVVLVRRTSTPSRADATHVVARHIEQGEAALYSRIAVEGWRSEAPQLEAYLEELGAISTNARGSHCFIAELGGRAIAAGALNVHNGVALLAGACTIPDARRQGAQLALLHTRLTFAASLGIDVAMVVTAPGSASQRNAERQGFQAVYTRAKWRLDLTSVSS